MMTTTATAFTARRNGVVTRNLSMEVEYLMARCAMLEAENQVLRETASLQRRSIVQAAARICELEVELEQAAAGRD